MTTETLVAQLKEQYPYISQFQALSGSPALTLGVFRDGEVIHTAHFGHKDVDAAQPPNDETVYQIASLSRILTVSSIARLVHDHILDWDVPIVEYVPEFSREDDVGLSTLRDLISNRTGLTLGTFFWSQQHGELILRKSEMVRLAARLSAVRPFRKHFLYSQWNYILVQIVIERVTGKPFGTVAQEAIILPLGLKNTTFGIPTTDNVAAPHAVRDDGTATKIETNPWTDESGIAAGAGGKSSLNDLLTIYIKLLSALRHQRKNGVDTTPGSPFVLLRTIFEPQIKARSVGFESSDYCLGLYRTVLPGNLSISSWNMPLFGKKLPVFGETLPGVEIYHHTLSCPGYMGSMFFVPHSNTGVVVLSNATPKLDATDLSAQLFLGVVLGERHPELVQMARLGPKLHSAIYRHISSTLEKGRTSKPPSLSLRNYAGRYFNSVGNFFIEVAPIAGGLCINIQGNARVKYEIYPYDGDTFYWPIDREKELCDKAMWPHLDPSFHTVSFGVKDNGVDCLSWHHDMMDRPERFVKRQTRSIL